MPLGARFTYATTLTCNAGSVTDVDVEVSYVVTWGRPETPPAYDHGGLPADPDEIDEIKLLSVDGVGGPFDQHDEAAILQEIAQTHLAEMLEEAADHDHQMDWANSDDRDDY